MSDSKNASFQEVQKFRSPILWLCLIFIVAGVLATLYQMPSIQRVPEARIAYWAIVPLSLFLSFGLPVLFFLLRLETEVREEELCYRFFPLQRTFRSIHFSDIESVESKSYRPILDYGGWGIRWGPGGRAYTVSGNQGVHIELKSGSSFLLGSQRAEQLQIELSTKITELLNTKG